ncbi:uncharacterized protein LOC144350425 [Saccoglossus kowalevskii]
MNSFTTTEKHFRYLQIIACVFLLFPQNSLIALELPRPVNPCDDEYFYRGEAFGCNPCTICRNAEHMNGCEQCFTDLKCDPGWFFRNKDYGCHPCIVCTTPDYLPGCNECVFSTTESLPVELSLTTLAGDITVDSHIDTDSLVVSTLADNVMVNDNNFPKKRQEMWLVSAMILGATFVTLCALVVCMVWKKILNNIKKRRHRQQYDTEAIYMNGKYETRLTTPVKYADHLTRFGQDLPHQPVQETCL